MIIIILMIHMFFLELLTELFSQKTPLSNNFELIECESKIRKNFCWIKLPSFGLDAHGVTTASMKEILRSPALRYHSLRQGWHPFEMVGQTVSSSSQFGERIFLSWAMTDWHFSLWFYGFLWGFFCLPGKKRFLMRLFLEAK